MRFHGWNGAAGVIGAVVALAVVSSGASAARLTAPQRVHRDSVRLVPARHAPRRGAARGTSTNWSGYAVDGAAATQVIGTWTEPQVSCARRESSWSAPWVGIDGDTSSTVEQIGSDSDCQNGTPVYYAWYEMYPKGAVLLSMTIHPGDSLTGEVSYLGSGQFSLQLTDTSTNPNQTFSTVQTSSKAGRSSVEWIMEGPSNGLLSDFGSAFGFTAASGSIGGQTGPLGSLANPQPITMVTKKSVPRAVPTSIMGGNAFGVTWQHS